MSKVIDGVNQIDAEELQTLLKDEGKKIQFIDVREPHEYEAGHIPGVPLIPMNTIPAKLSELNKDETYVFICRSGSRSHQVSKYLQMQGFSDVSNFYGGMLSWKGDVKPGSEE